MLRYIDKSSLLRVLESFKTVFRSASTAVESYNELDSLVHELWECADLTSSVAEEPLLEVSLIKTIFDVSIIRASVEVNKALAKTLLEVRAKYQSEARVDDLLCSHRSGERL